MTGNVSDSEVLSFGFLQGVVLRRHGDNNETMGIPSTAEGAW